MQLIQSVVLGLVQGLTEFIPVSSSAHLVIVPWLFGWDDPIFRSLGFDVASAWEPYVALVVFFWNDWVRLIGAWFKSIGQLRIGADPDRRMAWFLLVACIPGAVFGVLFEHKMSSSSIPRACPSWAPR